MNAKNLAKYIIGKCYREGKPVTNLKLQKILYFLYLAYYDKYAKALFLDKFSAWKLGPVITDIYFNYQHYIGNPICEENSILLDLPNDEVKFIDENIEKFNSQGLWKLINSSKESEYWKEALKKGKGAILKLQGQ